MVPSYSCVTRTSIDSRPADAFATVPSRAQDRSAAVGARRDIKSGLGGLVPPSQSCARTYEYQTGLGGLVSPSHSCVRVIVLSGHVRPPGDLCLDLSRSSPRGPVFGPVTFVPRGTCVWICHSTLARARTYAGDARARAYAGVRPGARARARARRARTRVLNSLGERTFTSNVLTLFDPF